MKRVATGPASAAGACADAGTQTATQSKEDEERNAGVHAARSRFLRHRVSPIRTRTHPQSRIGELRGLGLAALVVVTGAATAAAAEPRAPTPESGIGVWYAPGAPATEDLWRPGDGGVRLLLRARVLDTHGAPVAGALVELWHADAAGVVHAERYRAALTSDASGRIRVSTVYPGYIWGPRHIHVVVTHPQHDRLVTRLFFKRDPVLVQSGRPDLAISLEDGRHEGAPALFADVELVLRRR